jgi:hypothetical protein
MPAQIGGAELLGELSERMRACSSTSTRGSAKRKPEARWRPEATSRLMAWRVSSPRMQS